METELSERGSKGPRHTEHKESLNESTDEYIRKRGQTEGHSTTEGAVVI